MKWRKAARIDDNQREIVAELRKIPGLSVRAGHDDILVGYQGRTYWYEIKAPSAVSKRTGEVLESRKKADQKKLESEWTGHYRIVSCSAQIIREIRCLTEKQLEDYLTTRERMREE